MSLFPVPVQPKSRSKKAEQPRRAGAAIWIVSATIGILIFIALHEIAGHPFLEWDDPTNFTRNPKFNPAGFASIGYYWAHPLADLWIPVTYSVWGLLAFMAQDVSTTGHVELDPHVFHAASLFFHIVASIGVLLVLRRFGLRVWPAAFGAMVFALHPLQVEAVAWASGLKDVLSGGLCIWAVWFYLGAADGKVLSRCWWRDYLLATLLFILAMLCKPQAVCLPAVLVAVEVLRRPGAWRQWSLSLLPWFALVIPIIVIGRINQPAPEEGVATPLIDRPLVAVDDLAFYAEKLLVPIHLTVDYARSTRWLSQHGPHVISWLVPTIILMLAALLWRRARWLAVGVGIFVCALLPILGFVPFDFQMYSNVANHYLYLAMLGPALIGAGLLQAALDRRINRWLLAGVSAIVVLSLMIGAYKQAAFWGDNFALFDRNLQLEPESFVANVQVGTHYSKAGEVDRAMLLYRRALLIKPHDAETRYDLANALNRQGRYQEAIEEYHEALQTWPKRPEVHMNLGVALMQIRDFEHARGELETANKLQPGNPGILYNLAIVAMESENNPVKARAYLLQALAADEHYRPALVMLQQINQMMRPQPPK